MFCYDKIKKEDNMDTYKDEFYSNFNDIMSFLNFINKIELNLTWFTGQCH